MTTHRDLYPEQYEHPLCGKTVRIEGLDGTYVVERVVGTRFDQLATLRELGPSRAYALRTLTVVDSSRSK